MYCRMLSGALSGAAPVLVRVEACATPGLPQFSIVGLPDAAVRESRERVRAALINSGFQFPVRRVTVNMIPARQRKGGTCHELALALTVLGAAGTVPPESLAGIMALGELDLCGRVLPVTGIPWLLHQAVEAGASTALVPRADALRLGAVPGLRIIGVDTLGDIMGILDGIGKSQPIKQEEPGDCGMEEDPFLKITPEASWSSEESDPDRMLEQDFSQIQGQAAAVRAAVISAAGGHSLIMAGPPGIGKTMIARRMAGLLPPLSRELQRELLSLYEISGCGETRGLGTGGVSASGGSTGYPEILAGHRPFRSPHSGCTPAALAGGGTMALPGEVALAHGGLLFLDEACEMSRETLDALRAPLADGCVSISRAYQKIVYPCRVILVAATNLCPCGNRGDSTRLCRCPAHSVRGYSRRFSRALLDRFDLKVPMEKSQPGDQRARATHELARSVLLARKRAAAFFKSAEACNGQVPESAARIRFLTMTGGQTRREMEKLLSSQGRARDRILRVAMTIADLDQEQSQIRPEHIAEASWFVNAPILKI